MGVTPLVGGAADGQAPSSLPNGDTSLSRTSGRRTSHRACESYRTRRRPGEACEKSGIDEVMGSHLCGARPCLRCLDRGRSAQPGPLMVDFDAGIGSPRSTGIKRWSRQRGITLDGQHSARHRRRCGALGARCPPGCVHGVTSISAYLNACLSSCRSAVLG